MNTVCSLKLSDFGRKKLRVEIASTLGWSRVHQVWRVLGRLLLSTNGISPFTSRILKLKGVFWSKSRAKIRRVSNFTSLGLACQARHAKLSLKATHFDWFRPGRSSAPRPRTWWPPPGLKLYPKARVGTKMSSQECWPCFSERNNAWETWIRPVSIPWKLHPQTSMLRRLIHSYYGSNLQPRLPMSNSEPISRPYITSTDGIARADRTRLVDERDRQITARRVDDRFKVKERVRKVGNFAHLPFPRLWRKIYF